MKRRLARLLLLVPKSERDNSVTSFRLDAFEPRRVCAFHHTAAATMTSSHNDVGKADTAILIT
jgi:hypothetical protein